MSFDSVSQHLPSYLGFSYLGRWVSPHGLLKNLSAGQEATVRTGHATTDWFQIGKAVRQGCILSPCLFNLYAVYIMRNAGLEEAQAGIKMPGAASRSWAGRQIGCVRGRGRMCPGGGGTCPHLTLGGDSRSWGYDRPMKGSIQWKAQAGRSPRTSAGHLKPGGDGSG